MQNNLGWHSRGYLPHCDASETIQSITFRLEDSLPLEVVKKLKNNSSSDVTFREQFEDYLDKGYGKCFLKDKDSAVIVEEALKYFDGDRYRLLAWCIMPNHVHVLIETINEWSLSLIVQSWKSFTAKKINKIYGISGALWQREYYDRYIRDAEHLAAIAQYIDMNPVKAQLILDATKWPFGSARFAGSIGAPNIRF